MQTAHAIETELKKAFTAKQSSILSKVIVKTHNELVRADDFNELKDIVRELGIKTGELAEAQKRTEERVEELAEAQKRTEERVEELAEAQKELAKAQKELAEAQKRTEGELLRFHRDFDYKFGAMGARWGIMTESAFRVAMKRILSDVGFMVKRFIVKDEEGIVFGYPEQIEIDVVIQNGKLFLIEIKSSIDKGDVYLFDKKVGFYQKYTNQTAYRKIIISPYIGPFALDIAKKLGIEVFSDINEVK